MQRIQARQQCRAGEGFPPLLDGTALLLHGTQPQINFHPKHFVIQPPQYVALLLGYFLPGTWFAPVGHDDGGVTTEYREDFDCRTLE